MSNRYLFLDDRKEELRELVENFPHIAQEFSRRYEMSWIFHENALEGTVLTEQEIIQALEIQVVADASLMPVLTTVRNHKAAIDTIRAEVKNNKKLRISQPFLKMLFELLERSSDRAEKNAEKGMLRKEMPLHRTYYHDILQPGKIQGELQKLLDYTGTAEFREFHPVKQATYVHWQFMQIFPFIEHNGRIARLLQSMYLIRGGYPPPIIHAIDRQRYFDALRMPLSALRMVLVEAVENSLQNAAKFVREKQADARKAASE